jgi:hypothetical protein
MRPFGLYFHPGRLGPLAPLHGTPAAEQNQLKINLRYPWLVAMIKPNRQVRGAPTCSAFLEIQATVCGWEVPCTYRKLYM